MLAGTEQHRPKRKVQLVNQTGAEILPDRGDPTANADVAISGRLFRLLQSGVDAVGDEVKRGASGHLERCPRVMGEDEGGHVVRRLVAPPAFPAFVGPRAAHW